MSSSEILAELRAIRDIVDSLADRVQDLEITVGDLQSRPAAAPVTVNCSVASATPASASPTAVCETVPTTPPRRGAAAYTEGERRVVAEQIGKFLCRSVLGDHRGESGRSRINLPSRLYVLCKDINEVRYNPVKVFPCRFGVRGAPHTLGGKGSRCCCWLALAS